MKRDILGMVLAGGESRRMGQDKAKLFFHEGMNQLDYTLNLLQTFCSRIGISCRVSQRDERRSEFDAEIIPDAHDVSGPMAGVIAGLRHEDGGGVLVVACDMPLLNADLLLRLLGRRDPAKSGTCFIAEDGAAEPMCAIYEARALPVLEELAKAGSYSLRKFLEGADVERFSFGAPQMLASVNTLEDVEMVREQLTR